MYTKKGPAGAFSLSYEAPKLIVTLRGQAQNRTVEGDYAVIFCDCAVEGFTEIQLLAGGNLVRGRNGAIRLQGGLGYLGYREALNVRPYSGLVFSGYKYDTRLHQLPAATGLLSTDLFLGKHFGLTAEGYVNINTQKPFAGILIGLVTGRLVDR